MTHVDNSVPLYPGQRVLRTALSTLLTILPLIPQIIAIVQGSWDVEWLTAVGAQAILINSALTRILAIPVVDAFLHSVGLGSTPKSA